MIINNNYYNKNYSLRFITTFGVPIYAKKIFVAYTPKNIFILWNKSKSNLEQVIILGNGSNVLLLEDFTGTIILNRIYGINIVETKYEWLLHVGAGESWHNLVLFTLYKDIPGLENLISIPGCVGAAAIQNIGAYGVQFDQFCNYVDILILSTGKKLRIYSHECEFDYRKSIFQYFFKNEDFVIIYVGLRLTKNWKPIINYVSDKLKSKNYKKLTAKQISKLIFYIRNKKIPNTKISGNAGSFFKNPIITLEQVKNILIHHPNIPIYYQKNRKIKLSAGWLIENCNLKGYEIGGAAIYKKHALIIINKKNATSREIVLLANFIITVIKNKFNILLEPEVHFFNSSGKITITETLL